MMSPRYEDIRDRIMLSVSKDDHLRFRQMYGMLCVGNPGSGKSSALSKQIFCSFVRAGCGIFANAAKSGDAEEMKRWADECGYGHKVRIFNKESGLRFDPLAYEWTRSGSRGGGDIESIISYFSTLLSLGHPQTGGGNDRFFELAAEQAMRHAIKIIELAQEPLSIVNIHRAISSFPDRLGMEDEPEWQSSYIATLISRIDARKDSLSAAQWRDLETATQFVFLRWAALDPRLRSSIAMTFAGMADRYLFSPLRETFAGGVCDITPEQITHEGMILIVDYPPTEFGLEAARLINVMILLTYQRAWLRHQYKPGCCNGALLHVDEFQLLINRFSNQFAALSRSSGVCFLGLSQSLLGLADSLGESHLGVKIKAFCANLGLKFALRSTCVDTCTYYSDLIGKTYKYLDNYSTGANDETGQGNTGVGGSRQLVYHVEPSEFSSLSRPYGQSFFAEAIVFAEGDTFNATRTERNPKGSNYLRVFFSRE